MNMATTEFISCSTRVIAQVLQLVPCMLLHCNYCNI